MKNLIWLGNTKKSLEEFPQQAKREAGYGLHLAQKGKTHVDVKSFGRHAGVHVLEHVIDFSAETYRTYFTVSLGEFIYVLYVWHKKSKTGKATPKHVIELIRNRVLDAKAHALERKKRKE